MSKLHPQSHLLSFSYKENDCVPSKFICWSPNAQPDGNKRPHCWVVVRVRVGLELLRLQHMWWAKKDTPELPLFTLQKVSCEPARENLTKNHMCHHFVIGLPTLQTVRRKHLYWSTQSGLLGYGVLERLRLLPLAKQIICWAQNESRKNYKLENKGPMNRAATVGIFEFNYCNTFYILNN